MSKAACGFLLPVLTMSARFLVLISMFVCCSTESNLQLLITVFRHGSRSPVITYPNNPNNKADLFKDGLGKLDKFGELQLYELGKWIRNRYDNFLPDRYNVADVYIRSSPFDRCLMSAESFMAGAFYPKNEENKLEDLPWQPNAVNTWKLEDEYVLFPKKDCPMYKECYDSLIKTDEWKNKLVKFNEVASYCRENTGLEIPDLLALNDFWDFLHVQEMKNLTLPEWTQKVYPQPLLNLTLLFNTLTVATVEMTRLLIGSLVNEIVTHITESVHGFSSKKLIVYSGHDVTLLSLMKVFDYEENFPPFASVFIFEVYKNFSTKMYFRPDSKNLIFTGEWNFEKLLEKTKPFMLKDRDSACSTKSGTSKYLYDEWDLNSLGILLLVLLLIIPLIFVLVCCYFLSKIKIFER